LRTRQRTPGALWRVILRAAEDPFTLPVRGAGARGRSFCAQDDMKVVPDGDDSPALCPGFAREVAPSGDLLDKSGRCFHLTRRISLSGQVQRSTVGSTQWRPLPFEGSDGTIQTMPVGLSRWRSAIRKPRCSRASVMTVVLLGDRGLDPPCAVTASVLTAPGPSMVSRN
jgi:hypothetical protein